MKGGECFSVVGFQWQIVVKDKKSTGFYIMVKGKSQGYI